MRRIATDLSPIITNLDRKASELVDHGVLKTINCIESLNSLIGNYAGKVDRWRDSEHFAALAGVGDPGYRAALTDGD